ncbi:MAG TPA: hypothetical protein VH298_05920, partial [Jatrophihabitans sp.]|nr:hypothetical protein [Jatrophihabitans sp.]
MAVTAVTAAVALVAQTISGQQAVATPTVGKRPAVHVEKRVVGTPVAKPAPRSHPAAAGPQRALARTWPAATTTTALLPASSKPSPAALHRVTNSPVLLADAAGAARTVAVRVAARLDTALAGVNGVLFQLSGTPTSGQAGLAVGLDYTGFADAGGADFGQRLRLVQLPACALTTPTVRTCQQQRTVPSTNDARTHTLRTTAPVRVGSAMVLAAVAGASSSNGSFTASTLSPSGSWSAGGATGAFNWSYPLSVPASATGADVAPSVALSYSSSSIDGQIATSNNQSSWVGEGWDYSPGYIERTYRTCSDTANPGDPSYTSDECWAGQIVTMNLGGSTIPLVRDDTTGAWHPASDSAQQVALATGANNGALNGEYWKVTTTDGITYVFGENVLPGDTVADATNSTLLMPVYGSKSGDPCYNATFANASCTQAWRWNLDYVVDPHGNATAYHYNKETNNYGADNATTAVGYDRAATLDHIDYGLRQINGSITAHPATNRISFTTANRCFATDCSFTTANASNWPDTPVDQQCDPAPAVCNNHAPTFWSTKRLSTITTNFYDGAGYAPVDRYDLGQSFPATGDEEVGLDSISHTGYSSTGVQSSPLTVSFISALLANRVPNTNNQPDMYFWRLTEIDSETGTATLVTYGQPNGQDCTASTLPADPANDSQLCFPVKWTPPFNNNPILDYFQKYLVTKVTVIPQDGRSATQLTQYNYLGTPAWHADDNEVVKPANRSYGQFRGFGQVETLSGDTGFTYHTVPDRQTLTRTTYYRGMGGTVSDSLGEVSTDSNQYADSVHEQQTFDGTTGPELSTAITDLATTATTASRARSGLPALTANIVRTAVSRTITDEPGISSTAKRTATSSHTYDSLGRVVQETDSGSGSAATDAVATTCNTTSYADPVAGNTRYIRDRVAEKIVSEQSCPALGTTPSPIRSDVRSYYDTTTKAAGVGGVGDPTEVDTRLDSGLTGVTPYFGRTTASYDTAGRMLKSTQFVSATDSTGRTTGTVYTPTLPSTVGSAEPMAGPLTQTVVSNAKTQSTTTSFDPGRGVPIQVKDIAQHYTYADYDSLGRLTAVWHPGQVHGTDPASATYSYLVAATGPSSVTTKTLIDNGQSKNYRTSITLLDSFGQLIQTQSSAVGGGSIVTDAYRDSHGWPIDTNNHWLSSTAPATGLIHDDDVNVADRTETSYDGAGRAVLAKEFNGLTQTWQTQTVYGGNQSTVVPPTGGVAQTTVTDARGETAQLLQYTAAPTVTGNAVTGPNQSTGYLYTALGQQKEIDFAGRKWTSTYDLGGRLTTSTDPASGTTTRTYDDAGDLLTSQDANNVVLSYHYDTLGRKDAEYHTTTQTAANELNSWLYDTLQAGKLTSSTHYANSTTAYTVATG